MTDKDKRDKRQIENDCLEQASIMSGGGCGVCERKGFPLLLVRKSVIPKQLSYDYGTQKSSYSKSFRNIPWSQGMVSLGDREPSEGLETHEACFRLLRTGYVYIFLRTRGTADSAKRAVLAYEVTPSGCFRHKAIKTTTGLKNYQVEEIPPSCVKKNHYIPARFVTVDHTRYSHAWIAYSAHPWSLDVLENYRALPESQMTRFTCITLPKNSTTPAAELTQGRSFAASDFFADEWRKKAKARYLLELEFDKQDLVRHYYDFIAQHQQSTTSTTQTNGGSAAETDVANKEMNLTQLPEFYPDVFYTASHFNSLKKDTSLYDQQLSQFKRYFSDTPAVVVEDCLGLAEELAVQKRIALRTHAIGLLQTEANIVNKESQAFIAPVEANLVFTGDIFEQQKRLLKTAGHQNHDLYNMMYSELVGNAKQDEGSFNEQIVARDRAKLEKKQASSPDRYDYHQHEMIFKRRLLTNIENFEQGIIEKYQDKTPPETFEAFFYSSVEQYQKLPHFNMTLGMNTKEYKLAYQDNDVFIGLSKDQSNAPFYTMVTDVSDAERKALLAKFNQYYYQYQSGSELIDLPDDFGAQHVVLYRYQPKPYLTELKKYQSLINRPLLKLFKQEVELSYGWMMADIKQITQDYFTYATWLIADPNKQKLSKFGPALARYNNVPFWLTEVSANCSNAHIGYLIDMVTIFQPEHLGSIKLEYQFSLWDNLLRDENTLYSHLLKGGTTQGNNLWDRLIALRQDPANEQKSTNELIDAMYQAIEQQALLPSKADRSVTAPNTANDKTVSSEEVSKLNDLFDLPTDKAQTKLVVRLFDLLSEKTSISLANMPKGEVLNRIFTQKQLADSAMALFGRKLQVFTYKVKASDLRYAMNALQKSNPAILNGFTAKTAEGRTIPMTYDSVNNSWQLPASERNKMVLLDVVTVTNNVSEMNELEKKIKNSKTFNRLVKDNGAIVIMTDKSGLTQADFDAVFAYKRRQIMIEEGKATLFQGLLFGINVYNLSTQYGAYNLTIAQQHRDKMRREMGRALLDVMLMLPPLVSSGTKFSAATFASYFNKNIQDAASLLEAFKTIGMAAKYAGIAASVLTIYDGACSFNQGLSRYQEGEGNTASLYLVGSVCQMASGALSALALLFPAMPFLVVVVVFAFIFGVVAWILLSLFKDPSDEWDPMQTWFNRCYFGKWTHKKKKGEPYPPTDVGYCLAHNDYTVALLNCAANVALEDRKYASKNTHSYAIQSLNDGLGRKLQLNMNLSGFDRNKSDYKGQLLITDRQDLNKTVLLQFYRQKKHVDVIEIQSTVPAWHMRAMAGIEISELEYMLLDEKGQNIFISEQLVASEEPKHNEQISDELQQSKIYFLRVNQVLGIFADSGVVSPYHYRLVMHYWRDKVQDPTPLVISYEYQAS
ncbi:hypothetical protein DES39_2171 [Orbus hercynius]|uniref:Toxin VasX N-terminal region domain-containing protein n=1 Tax=Orbus hercynius TaxID=593135 RepID=A0A495RAG3_9GAMM|nr:toxin VasX [Orbus hercynius]RKS84432.1 hypothetical protein DES39_2171 [Orbus hercynius]